MAWYDSTGKFVGIGSPGSTQGLVLVNSEWVVAGFAIIYPGGPSFPLTYTLAPTNSLVHESGDCNGPAYLQEFSGMSPGATRISAIGYVGPSPTLYIGSSTLVRRTISSQTFSNWNGTSWVTGCNAFGPTEMGTHDIAQVVGLAGLWTPPFSFK